MFKRSLALFGAACLAAIVAAAPASAQKTKLTVYTAMENDQLGPFKQAIEAAVPEVEIVWVRDSTGVITARFLAEKDNPRADVVFGLAVTSLIAVREAGAARDLRAEGRVRAQAGVPRRHTRPTPGPAWTPICRWSASTRSKARRTTSRRRHRGRTSPSPNTRARS